jgi:arginine decarboxylase
VADLVPEEFRESHVESLYNIETGWVNLFKAWRTDEFALDPSRATLAIGLSGMDGDTMKNKYLADKYDIQINKTSRNTVLFMTNIGSTRSTIAYLIEVLVNIARDIDQKVADMSTLERRIHEKRVRSLTVELPPLPNFSCFHTAFRGRSVDGRSETRDGDIRSAFFLGYDEGNCEYLGMDETEQAMKERARMRFRPVRHSLPARLPDPGAGSGDQCRDIEVHAGARCARDPWFPA